MQTLAVNGQRDLFLDRNGNLAVSRDIDAIGATCTQVMSTMEGEFLFDTRKGVDYNNTVFASGADGVPDFNNSGTNALLGIDGVIDVVFFYSNDRGQYRALVASEFGQAAVGN